MDERTFTKHAEDYAGRLYAVAYRMLIALHYVNGLGYRELAAIRGISVNTVKSQLARGKAILKQALQAGGHDGSD